MSEVNDGKFYLFLSQYRQNDKNWVNVVDSNYGNGDGTVIKSEFRAFLNAEWNGEETLTNDLINSFWKKLDTNTSASKISGTKLRNLNALDEKELEIHLQFDKFIANEVTIPAGLATTGSKWKADVIDDLAKYLDPFINGEAEGSLEEFLSAKLPKIKNKYTAQYAAVEYQETLSASILKDYPDYKVGDDSTLQNLINTYISQISEDTDESQLIEEIRSILDAYFATADLGEDSGYDLNGLGFNSNNLNGIQIEVIKQSIKNDLTEEAKNYEGYETQFDEAVQKFIEAKIKEGGDFETLKASATEFLTSEFKTQLDNSITIDKNYRDVVESNDSNSFYQKLVKEFGESLAKKIAENDRYLQAYKDIINDVTTKVSNGELTMDKVEAYILEQISANIEKFFPNGLGDMTIKELNETYDKLAASAEAQTDDDVALSQHRSAAIQYCDAISKKSNELKAAVTEIFGSNYKNAINSLYPGEIATKMSELKAKAIEIGDVSTFTISTWSGLPDNNETIYNNSTNTYNISAIVSNGTGTVDPSKVSYSIESVSGGKAEITDLGTLTITSGDKEGYLTVEIAVIVGGKKIGTKSISITNKGTDTNKLVNSDTVMKLQDITDWNTENLSFDKLYNGDRQVVLYGRMNTKGHNWSNVKNTVKNNLRELGNQVVDVLAAAGLDKPKLLMAMNTVVDKYCDATVTRNDNDTGKRRADLRNNCKNYMTGNRESTANRITWMVDDDGKNSNIYMIHFKDFVDDILKEYGI